MSRLKILIIANALFILGFGCERGTIICEEIEYIEKPHEPCISKPAPIYHPGELLYGRLAGLKNCLPFMASTELYFFNYQGKFGTDLVIQTFEDWGNTYFGKELMLVGALAFQEGTYSMYILEANDYEASYSILQDFDVLEDVFEIDRSYNQNQITFTVLDTISGYARGYFNCRFLLASTNPSGYNPDTVVFNECHFEAWKKQ